MSHRISARASTDMDEIAIYTIGNWGSEQADKYLWELEEMFRLLAETPGIGRLASFGRPGTRRMECGSHVIFYRETRRELLISAGAAQEDAFGTASALANSTAVERLWCLAGSWLVSGRSIKRISKCRQCQKQKKDQTPSVGRPILLLFLSIEQANS